MATISSLLGGGGIKSIQRGTYSFSGGCGYGYGSATYVFVPNINVTAVDLSKSVLLFSVSSVMNGVDYDILVGYMLNSTTIAFDGRNNYGYNSYQGFSFYNPGYGGSSSYITIKGAWQLIEFK